MQTERFIDKAIDFAKLLQGHDEGKEFDRVFDIADDDTRAAGHLFITYANIMADQRAAEFAAKEIDETILDDRRHAKREREEAKC